MKSIREHKLASQLFLLLAKDTYVRRNLSGEFDSFTIPDNDSDDKWTSELIDCQQVSIVEFLEYLFGTSFWVIAGDAAKESFRHAYINFSHWVPMDQCISPKSRDGYVPVRCQREMVSQILLHRSGRYDIGTTQARSSAVISSPW